MAKIGIAQAAIYLDRKEGTIRKWEREGILPEEFLPTRDERNRREWTVEQLEGMKQWLIDTDRRPGKGLPHYNPSPEKLHEHLERQRTSKR